MERITEHSMDEVFLKELNDIVFINLNNEQFGAEELAKEIGVSRSQIYRKLHKINGKTISQFIREIRLEEALKLLQSETGTASEISYQVGFSSPTYFNKCFHDHYGYTLGQVKNRKEEISIKEESAKILLMHDAASNSTEEHDQLLNNDANTQLPPSSMPEASGQRLKFIQHILSYYIIAVFVVIIVGVLISYRGEKGPLDELEKSFAVMPFKSIAVLPFKTITKDSTSQYIADGVREAILNNLLIIKNMNVVSGNSLETYRNSNKKISEIAGELDIATIMTGSAQKFGNQIRISVQLING